MTPLDSEQQVERSKSATNHDLSINVSILNSKPIISRQIKNCPHRNLHNLIIKPIRNPRPEKPRPPLHRRIQQPQARRMRELSGHQFVLPLHHNHLQR